PATPCAPQSVRAPPTRRALCHTWPWMKAKRRADGGAPPTASWRYRNVMRHRLALLLVLAASRLGAQAAPASPPPVAREFRAVWVATVANIDWPSKPGLSTWDQQRELLAILDRAVALNLNAVILQVRPGADAFFASPYEPWSQFL